MDLIAGLQSRLQERARPKTKAWWERYLKHAITFRGVKMDGIRAALHSWLEAECIHELPPAQQTDLALQLLRQPLAEDKLAGILYLQEVLLLQRAIDCQADLPRLARLFDEGHIDEWNTCDWLCVKVLGPLVEQQGQGCARAIAEWRQAANLWRSRASAVAFVNLAAAGEDNFPGFAALVLQVCDALLARQERFAQTGAGWVLRELARADQASVAAFVKAHLERFSREALRKAIEGCPQPLQQSLLDAHRRRA